MKKNIILIMIAIAIISLPSCKKDKMKISIFAEHIEEIANQNNISFSQAAKMVWDMGYRGVDCQYKIDPEHLRVLDSIGFYHAMALGQVFITMAEHQEDVEEVLEFMKNNNFKYFLLVPGMYRSEPTNEDRRVVIERWRRIADKAESMGLKIMAEVVDYPRTPLSNMLGLDWVLEEVPNLGCVFDFGNYIYAGDDVLDAYEHVRTKIDHVHLKDRQTTQNKDFTAIGDGIAPFKDVIVKLKEDGYEGWYTVEIFDSPDMLSDARKSINYLLNDKDLNP